MAIRPKFLLALVIIALISTTFGATPVAAQPPHRCGGTVGVPGVPDVDACEVRSEGVTVAPVMFIAGMGATPTFTGVITYHLIVTPTNGKPGFITNTCRFAEGVVVLSSCDPEKERAVCPGAVGQPCTVEFKIAGFASPRPFDVASWAVCYDVANMADVETMNTGPVTVAPCPSNQAGGSLNSLLQEVELVSYSDGPIARS